MDEDMNTSELLKTVTEDNQTRKIISILAKCENLQEAIEKITALLHEQ